MDQSAALARGSASEWNTFYLVEIVLWSIFIPLRNDAALLSGSIDDQRGFNVSL